MEDSMAYWGFRSSGTARPFKMKALFSLKAMGTICPMTQHHILEDLNPQQHRCENLQPHSMIFMSC